MRAGSANQPSVLLMDEPFAAGPRRPDPLADAALPDRSIKQIRDPATRQIAQRNTIVFVTHDIDEAVYVGDRIYVGTPPRPLVLGGCDEIRVSFLAPSEVTGLAPIRCSRPRWPRSARPSLPRPARRRRPRRRTHPMSRIGHHRPEYPDQFGQFKMSYHLEMVSDRSPAHRRAVRGVAAQPSSGDGLLRAGVRRGSLSIYRRRASCKKVFAVGPRPGDRRGGAGQLRRSRFAERIELIVADALDVTLPERVDIAFCEMMFNLDDGGRGGAGGQPRPARPAQARGIFTARPDRESRRIGPLQVRPGRDRDEGDHAPLSRASPGPR